MKFLSLLGVMLLLGAGGSLAQENTIENGTADLIYDFGTITKDADVSRIFKLYNNTTEPLRIRSIWASPYCNVAAWSKKPIKSGKYGLMKVTYNASKTGPFTASLKVIYYDNAATPEEKDLIRTVLIKGMVRDDEPGKGYVTSLN